MKFNGKLILEDGTEFLGVLNGTQENSPVAEVVFNTSMVGYQEILTDPSCDQIICMTYPLIGNYGVNQRFAEAKKTACKGFIVRELCDYPSHFENEITLDQFFKDNNLVCLSEVDTRAVTKKIREHGTFRGVITGIDTSFDSVKDKLQSTELKGQVSKVSSNKEEVFGIGEHVVLYDFGYKANIKECLVDMGFKVTVVPYNTPFERVKELNPKGVCLSNGPGNPDELVEVIAEIKKVQESFPTFGICLGHQLLALANGAKTEKMLYGHRGGNHPVKDLETGRVFMSSQNHGYVVKEDSLSNTPLVKTFINVNDGTLEGMSHKTLPVFSVQFHPEYRPGPRDTNYLFEKFKGMMEAAQ